MLYRFCVGVKKMYQIEPFYIWVSQPMMLSSIFLSKIRVESLKLACQSSIIVVQCYEIHQLWKKSLGIFLRAFSFSFIDSLSKSSASTKTNGELRVHDCTNTIAVVKRNAMVSSFKTRRINNNILFQAPPIFFNQSITISLGDVNKSYCCGGFLLITTAN